MSASNAELVGLLNARAKLPQTEDGIDRQTIVRFDAWTDPWILKFLVENADLISTEARRMFCDHRPEIHPDLLSCAYQLLVSTPRDRAQMVADGKDYGFGLKMEGDSRAVLQGIRAHLGMGTTGRSPPARVLLPLLIKKLANYMHGVFNLHLSLGNRPPSKLDRLFARFASGALRIKESDGAHSWMNAEPDSAYFFAFAEFCIQAAHFNAFPGRKWWIDLGGLFAALQDPYCVRYHRKGGNRSFADYGEHFVNDNRKMEVPLLLKHVKSVRLRCSTLKKLVDQVTWNAFWYFFDDVQPLAKSPTMKLSPPPPRLLRPPR